MADNFNFELVSPERLLLSQMVTEVVIPATEGEMTVMANHAPTMTTVKPGTRVTNHFYLTCGQCRQCRAGGETLCLDPRGNRGAASDGGYAEYVVLPERNTI